MTLPTHFISCDWGTSNFRLHVVVSEGLRVLAAHSSDTGIKALNERFGGSERTDRLFFFSEFIRSQVEQLPEVYRHFPIVVSGMASANIGMRDLPYGELPIGPGGESFVFQDLTPWPGQILRLISGVKSSTGMMRGEETQALGLLERMASAADGVLLLPGTHSKHLTFWNGQFTDFTSYMTGELFDVISRQSILANSVASGEWNTRTGAQFSAGVLAGFKDGVTHHLFAIRAGHVLQQAEHTDSFYRLSGLLIGDELRHLPEDTTRQVYLAGSGPLLRLYHFALDTLGFGKRMTVYDDEVLRKALLSGQRMLLTRTA